MQSGELDARIEARLLGLETLVTGLYGVLVRSGVLHREDVLTELASCETDMRKLNVHDDFLVMLRTAREHVAERVPVDSRE